MVFCVCIKANYCWLLLFCLTKKQELVCKVQSDRCKISRVTCNDWRQSKQNVGKLMRKREEYRWGESRKNKKDCKIYQLDSFVLLYYPISTYITIVHTFLLCFRFYVLRFQYLNVCCFLQFSNLNTFCFHWQIVLYEFNFKKKKIVKFFKLCAFWNYLSKHRIHKHINSKNILKQIYFVFLHIFFHVNFFCCAFLVCSEEEILNAKKKKTSPGGYKTSSHTTTARIIKRFQQKSVPTATATKRSFLVSFPFIFSFI